MIISATVRTLSSDQRTGFEAWDSHRTVTTHQAGTPRQGTKKWIQHQQNGQTWDTAIKRSLSVVTSSIRDNRIILNWRDAVKTEKGWEETLHWNVRSDPALKCGEGRDVQMPPFYCRTLKLNCNIRSYFQFFCALCSATYCWSIF